MDEQTQILYMQVRLVQLASEKWNMSIKKVNKLFKNNNVYKYISELWGLFHVESDYAVLNDIKEYLTHKGALND